MERLKNYWFYHGTSLNDAKTIGLSLKHNKYIRGHRGFILSQHVGSLGNGAYAFAYSAKEACDFAYYKDNIKDKSKIGIVKFKLRHSSQIIDFTDPKQIINFEIFTEKYRNMITHLKKYHHIKNELKVSRLDGNILNMLINIRFSKLGVRTGGVYNVSQNDLSGKFIPHSRIPNSIELNIRRNSIINLSSVQVLDGYLNSVNI